MEYFRLEHPPDRVTLCDRSDCEDIADYLEVNEHGREEFVCAAHTSSERHASVLPKGVPSAEPRRSRPAATELEGKRVHIGEGALNVGASFANRNEEIGDLGRNFTNKVQPLRGSREEMERPHPTRMPRAERLDTLGNVAGLAHEIRNALGSIAVVIELVGRDLPVTSPASAMVKHARQEIAHINHVLTDLLQDAPPHAPEVFPSDLNMTVEHAVVLARQQVLSTAIGIEFEEDPNLPSVEHDRGQIHQVVLNLLLNAVQAIDGAGTIRVEISLLKGDAAITVTDTGCGIAPEHLTNIFRPFYTTKAKGTGLGLSLARQIVEEHCGRIEVTSEVGKGSTFLVILPLEQPRAESAAS